MKPNIFAQHLDWLKKNGYHTISFKELHDDKALPENPVIITFDDAYRSTYLKAFPMLKARKMKATHFVVPQYLDHPGWLTHAKIRNLAASGMEIGSHTFNHQNLAGCTDEELVRELKDSKEFIERITGRPVEFLSYPCGYYNEKVLAEAKKYGYKAGASSLYGGATKQQDRMLWHRIPINHTIMPWHFSWKIKE